MELVIVIGLVVFVGRLQHNVAFNSTTVSSESLWKASSIESHISNLSLSTLNLIQIILNSIIQLNFQSILTSNVALTSSLKWTNTVGRTLVLTSFCVFLRKVWIWVVEKLLKFIMLQNCIFLSCNVIRCTNQRNQ